MPSYKQPRKPVNRLLDPLETRFVKAFMEELDFAKACEKSQVSPRAGRKMMEDAAVRAVIGDQVGQLLEKTQINASRVAEEFAVLAFSNIFNIVSISEDGESFVVRDMSTIPPNIQASVKEISFTPSKYGTSIKVTMHEKLPALKMLAQITELGTVNGEAGGEKDYSSASTKDLLAVIERIRPTGENIVPFKDAVGDQ